MKDLFINKNNDFINMEVSSKKIDPFDPFDNPTEKHYYNDSYTEIVPELLHEDYKMKNIPTSEEKKRIRHFYNVAGFGLLIHLGLTFILSQAFYYVITFIIMFVNNMGFSDMTKENNNLILHYINTSSISPAITILTYLTANLIVFFYGSKIVGIKPESLFKVSNCKLRNIISYIFIAIFIQFSIGLIISLIQQITPDIDILGSSASFSTYYSTKYAALTIIYTCVVAPVTEELLYRGFVQKAFSKVSQRFGIVMSALFFGLGHGNIAQFALAFLLGIFLGYISVKHNSIIPSMIVHAAVNILSTVITVKDNYFYENVILDHIADVSIIILSVVGLFMLIIFCKNNVFPKSKISQQYRCGNIALKSIGTVLALIVFVSITFYISFLY